MSLDKDNDGLLAFNMIDHFKRNGVLVKELKEDSWQYKRGTWSRHGPSQRGYANHTSTRAPNELPGLRCAELLVNFQDMRGFKSEPIFADAFSTEN